MKFADSIERFNPLREKLKRDHAPPLLIDLFQRQYAQLLSGHTGVIPSASIEPVENLPRLDDLDDFTVRGEQALDRAVMIKLNGGLGTGMGLAIAKSLLPVKNGLTFLDIIARQVTAIRHRYGCRLPLVFMNSFSTDQDTRERLASHGALTEGQGDVPLAFLQHRVPKIAQSDYGPVSWPAAPSLEWCPPGHGDIYTALVTSGTLDALLRAGCEYAFISNSDNLGATLDLHVLGYFAERQFPFMMEVTRRTEADRKGGHLAHVPGGGLILRESAQCPADEQEVFQDIECYRFFNTNNLWVNLKALQARLADSGGVLELPVIVNSKTVDPKDACSPPVYQLETAMGAALAVFPDAQALEIPRNRFAPVKTTDDLLALRSDIFLLNEQAHIVCNPARTRGTIVVHLDPVYYRLMDDFDRRFPHGAPSLVECDRLTVEGDILFEKDVTLKGAVHVRNAGQPQGRLTPHTVIHTDGQITDIP